MSLAKQKTMVRALAHHRKSSELLLGNLGPTCKCSLMTNNNHVTEGYVTSSGMVGLDHRHTNHRVLRKL